MRQLLDQGGPSAAEGARVPGQGVRGVLHQGHGHRVSISFPTLYKN